MRKTYDDEYLKVKLFNDKLITDHCAQEYVIGKLNDRVTKCQDELDQNVCSGDKPDDVKMDELLDVLAEMECHEVIRKFDDADVEELK